MNKINQRGSIQLIIILFLLVGILAGVYIFKSGTLLKFLSSASNPQVITPPTIEFVDGSGNTILQTSSNTVNVVLSAPWPSITATANVFGHQLAASRISQNENVAGTSAYIIYNDSLQNGWTDASYKTNVNYNNTVNVASGTKSIMVTFTRGYGGLEFNAPRQFSTSPYTHVQFMVHATQANEDLAIYIENSKFGSLNSTVRLYNYGGYPSTTGWTTYTIPLKDLNATARTIGDITIQNNTNHSLPTLYVDQVQLVNLPSSTSPSPTSTPTPPISTPIPSLFTQSVTLAEDTGFSTNVKTISPYTTNPYPTSYTFSTSTPGTKTLYAKFTASDGTTQTISNTIQLLVPTPSPSPISSPVATPTPTAIPGNANLQYPFTYTIPYNTPVSSLPSDADCAATIIAHRSTPDPDGVLGANNSAGAARDMVNQYDNNRSPLKGYYLQNNTYIAPYRLNNNSFFTTTAKAWGFTPSPDVEAKITGDFTSNSTDEIIQWAACKWGIDVNVVRAQVEEESDFFQGILGDCTPGQQAYPGITPCQTFGLGGLRGGDTSSTAAYLGSWPYGLDSTAFNLDYSYAVRRQCFMGRENIPSMVSAGYTGGDLWGCIGTWYSGLWHDPAGNTYSASVQNNYNNKLWKTNEYSDQVCTNMNSWHMCLYR